MPRSETILAPPIEDDKSWLSYPDDSTVLNCCWFLVVLSFALGCNYLASYRSVLSNFPIIDLSESGLLAFELLPSTLLTSLLRP